MHIRNYYDITLGADPELELLNWDGKVVYAGAWIKDYYHKKRIGLDGSHDQIEFRIKPSNNPKKLVDDFKTLLLRAIEKGLDLSIKGDDYPLGGHIHLAASPEFYLIKALDKTVKPLFTELNGKARGRYDSEMNYRVKKHGFEYRPLPAGMWYHPRLAEITLKLVQGIVEMWYSGEVERGFLMAEEQRINIIRKVIYPDEISDLYYYIYNYKPENLYKNYGIEIVFNNKDVFSNFIINKLKTIFKGESILFYGLHQDRGDVYCVDKLSALTEKGRIDPIRGSVNFLCIGLPYNLRIVKTDKELLKYNNILNNIKEDIEIVKNKEVREGVCA